MTGLGVGFSVAKNSPLVFLRKSHSDSWYLCERKPNSTFGEIIAEFKYGYMAEEALKARRTYLGIHA